MRKVLFLGLIVVLTASCTKQEAGKFQDADIEAKVSETLGQLTLEEKIGQMMQLVTDLFGTTDANGVFHIDPAKADTLFSKYKIGSILNVPNGHAQTPGQWEEIIGDIQELSMKHIGVPTAPPTLRVARCFRRTLMWQQPSTAT